MVQLNIPRKTALWRPYLAGCQPMEMNIENRKEQMLDTKGVIRSSMDSPGIGRIAFRVVVIGLLQKLIGMAAIFTATQNGVNYESATSSDLQVLGIVLLGLFATVISPLVETIALQALPLELMRKKGIARPLAILVSAIMFGLWHAHEGAAKVISTFVVGLMLAWVYERYRDENTIPSVPAVTAAQADKEGFWAATKFVFQDLFSRFSLTGFMYVALPHAVSNTIAMVAILMSTTSIN